jgi:hypothetical protein
MLLNAPTHPVDTNILNPDVLIQNPRDAPRRPAVGLDPRPVLRVEHHRVPERDVGHGVVALSPDRTDREPVRPVAPEVADGDVLARGDRHAVVLVVHEVVAENGLDGSVMTASSSSESESQWLLAPGLACRDEMS